MHSLEHHDNAGAITTRTASVVAVAEEGESLSHYDIVTRDCVAYDTKKVEDSVNDVRDRIYEYVA